MIVVESEKDKYMLLCIATLSSGSLTILLTIFAVFMVAQTYAAGSCPQSGKVYSCSPKCLQNYDCSNGKVCCDNQCHTKSCVEPAPYGGSSGGKDKYSSGGAGSYCDNVKCNAFETCKLDPATKRMKCMRT